MAIIPTLRWLYAVAERARDERGQAMVEYALLISLIAVVCITIVQIMGLSLSSLYNSINTQFP